MEINNLLLIFEQRLRMQRFSDASIRNYKSAVDNFLRLASKKYQKPEELDAEKIENSQLNDSFMLIRNNAKETNGLFIRIIALTILP